MILDSYTRYSLPLHLPLSLVNRYFHIFTLVFFNISLIGPAFFSPLSAPGCSLRRAYVSRCRSKPNDSRLTTTRRHRGAWRLLRRVTLGRRQMLRPWVDPRAHSHPIISSTWSRWWGETIVISWGASPPSTTMPTLTSTSTSFYDDYSRLFFSFSFNPLIISI